MIMMRTARLERALEHAVRAPSVHNTQPWRWQLHGNVIELFADVDRRLPGNDPSGRDLLISCGAALHHFVVALAHEGHDASVERLPDPGDDTHLATITVNDAPPDPTTARLFDAIERRHTERRRMSYRPVPPPVLEALVESSGRFGVRIEPTHAVREAFARAFAEAGERERWTPAHTTELRIWSRGRAPASPAPREDRLRHDAAEFLLLSTAEDRTSDRLRAGEALSSLLLTATSAGLAGMPLSLDPGGGALDDGGSRTPQIVARVGWPLDRDTASARTRRRDLTSILVPAES